MDHGQPEITWTHPCITRILNLLPKAANSLLDVGCGKGIVGALCRIYRGYERLVGIDVYEPYLQFCAYHKLYDELLHWDLENVPLPFRDGEFDVVTAIEVIEHLDKDAGRRLLAELERVGRRIVVTTPNRFFKQPAYDGNDWQRHRSVWRLGEFRSLGYQAGGCGGLLLMGRPVRGLSTLLGGFSVILPQWSEYILCVKDVRK